MIGTKNVSRLKRYVGPIQPARPNPPRLTVSKISIMLPLLFLIFKDAQTQNAVIEALRDLTDSLQNQNRDLENRNVSLNEEIAGLRHSLEKKGAERELGG